MSLRMSLLILALITATAGCGDQSARQRQKGRTTFVEGNRDSADRVQQELSPEAKIAKEAEKAAPLLLNGESKSSVSAYEMPKKLLERLEKTQPELAVKSSRRFQLTDQHLHISTKKSVMIFSGTLKIPGKQDEKIELGCKFQQAQVPWTCDQMYPVDKKVAEERRLQATINCLDTFRCENVGIELFVVIDGKTESQLFQNRKFIARKATSGDVEEEITPGVQNIPQIETIEPPVKAVPQKTPPQEKPQEILPPTQPLEIPPPQSPRVLEKPTREQPPVQAPKAEEKPQMDSEFGPELSEKELDEVMEDPNQAIEFSAPVPMPNPAKGKYSIPGIEQLRPTMGSDVKSQAIGSHASGILKSGATLEDSDGIMCRQRANRNYGTDLTIELLTKAAAEVNKSFPGKSPIVVANISKQGGGRLCNPSGSCHASHQTGLDVDVVFPSNRKVNDMWSLCGADQAKCHTGSHISDQFDTERFWSFAKSLTCAKGKPVIAMFVDKEIKRYMCRWVKQNSSEDLNDSESCAFRTLQAMKHASGHHNHVHVRFKCPGNRDCRDATVSLGRGTGC